VFRPDDDYLEDHFPGFPVVPGVLLTEAMGQTGGWVILESLRFARFPLLTMVERAKFRRLVRPGEELTIEALVEQRGESDFFVRGEARVGDERAAEARLLFHAFELPPDASESLTGWGRATWARLTGNACEERA
jgi:3-hydroxyacyl-[acyl-carrier-protein] dehydratase